MTDIVERLRADAEMSRDCSSNWEAFDCSEAMREAADEIARLRLSLSEARATGRREGLSEAADIAEGNAKTFNFQQALVDWDDMLVGGQSARLEVAAAIRAAMEKAE